MTGGALKLASLSSSITHFTSHPSAISSLLAQYSPPDLPSTSKMTDNRTCEWATERGIKELTPAVKWHIAPELPIGMTKDKLLNLTERLAEKWLAPYSRGLEPLWTLGKPHSQ